MNLHAGHDLYSSSNATSYERAASLSYSWKEVTELLRCYAKFKRSLIEKVEGHASGSEKGHLILNWSSGSCLWKANDC